MLSTVVDYVGRHESRPQRPSWGVLNSSAPTPAESTLTSTATLAIPGTEEIELQTQENAVAVPVEDPELRLPNRGSLVVVIATNMLLQFSFFVIVSSAASYAGYLGGSATFAGLTIGIPPVFSGLALIPLTRYDGGRYSRPLMIAYSALIVGNVCFALAYLTNFLYLILIGRVVCGLAFTGFLYSKRYCSDSRIIGIRRRTTLASWLVLGQAFGFTVGPFIGGLLFKVGFDNKVFNGYTSPGWVTASFTAVFAILGMYVFRDVPKPQRSSTFSRSVESAATAHPDDYGIAQLTTQQWGVIISMCWTAMTCFFILGCWEANIPVFTAASPAFRYTPYDAGNFIALGGVATIPFLLANVRYAPRIQDRATLAVGSAIGLAGLLLLLGLLAADRVVFGSYYVCWFLVALGFNLASTCTFSLLSKQFPSAWNGRLSMAIQYSNYIGRVSGGVLGGAGVQIGMKNYVAVQIGVVGIGVLLHLTFWKQLKAKTG